MRLGLITGYSGSQMSLDIELIRTAERLGFDSVWTAEAYGSDAVTPLAWIGAQTKKIRLGTAIMQLPGRSPANTAMTAMTLDALSGGRFILGLGTSGPQVVEGWHGVPFDKPLSWLREYVTIVKKILAREAPLEFQGERYSIPYRGPGGTGLGKPLKSILHGRRDIPIYTGSMAPKSQALSAEIADGLLLTCMAPGRFDLIEKNLNEGFMKSKRSLDNFDVAPAVAVIVGNDLEACRLPIKMSLALYVGGMGAKNDRDGLSAAPWPSNAGTTSAEIVESTTELLFRRRSLVPDSGGDGRYRGGLGVATEIELRSKRPAVLSMMTDRITHPPLGRNGGGPTSPNILARSTGGTVPAKGRTELKPGEVLIMHTPGGGGFGPPAERDPELRRRDAEFGYVTPD